jgi:hypothetical protein
MLRRKRKKKLVKKEREREKKKDGRLQESQVCRPLKFPYLKALERTSRAKKKKTNKMQHIFVGLVMGKVC